MTKKVRIKAWQENGDSEINMADRLGRQGRLGHQKLKKEYLAGPSLSMPWRVTGIIKNGADMPQDIILSIVFLNFLLKIVIFCLWRLFCSQKSCYLAIFWAFFNNWYAVFLMNGLKVHMHKM
jgi:hypothetical protein